jgi:hypothetical protein
MQMNVVNAITKPHKCHERDTQGLWQK